MGFPPERPKEWITEPGDYDVEIVGWRHLDPRRKRVQFEVRDSDGAKQMIRFGLSRQALLNGDLLRFVADAMGWRPVEHQGRECAVANRQQFDRLIGRRVVIRVAQDSKGRAEVCAWGPIQATAATE